MLRIVLASAVVSLGLALQNVQAADEMVRAGM